MKEQKAIGNVMSKEYIKNIQKKKKEYKWNS